MTFTARIDFTYGGVRFRRGDPVPPMFAERLQTFGGMYVDQAPTDQQPTEDHTE